MWFDIYRSKTMSTTYYYHYFARFVRHVPIQNKVNNKLLVLLLCSVCSTFLNLKQWKQQNIIVVENSCITLSIGYYGTLIQKIDSLRNYMIYKHAVRDNSFKINSKGDAGLLSVTGSSCQIFRRDWSTHRDLCG